MLKKSKAERTVLPLRPNEIGQRILSQKYGRNSPCECGSGRKAKHCHGAETKYFCTVSPERAAELAKEAAEKQQAEAADTETKPLTIGEA